MFAYLDNQMVQIWLTILLLLWTFLLFGGFAFGPNEDGRRMPVWTRLGSSGTLVLAGLSWTLISRDFGIERYALFLTIGMTFGFMGDLSLAKIFVSGKAANLGGIAAFGIGHIFYITAIMRFGNELGLNLPGPRFGSLIVWWLVAALGWYFVVYRGSKGTSLHWIVLPYALLLATTAGSAMGLALQEPSFWPLVMGAALFLLSDTILGGNWFNNLDFPLIHDLIWLTYGPGQMLIVYSVGAAIQLVI